MPISEDFEKRLNAVLPKAIKEFGTPFHIYDAMGIKETGEKLKDAFSNLESGFREYFAVKALPNPRILGIMKNIGFGFDCSSIPELMMARKIGAGEKDIMFTSNNTSQAEFNEALDNGGCIMNLDDFSLIRKIPRMPKLICFRYNPGKKMTGNSIIGNPVEAKYGVAHIQIVDAYKLAIKRGAERFGLHTMVCSNTRNEDYLARTVEMLLSVCEMVTAKLGIEFEFINMGGGIGIPYKPGDKIVDIEAVAQKIITLMRLFRDKNGYMPKLLMESGRYMTGPHGVLVTTCTNTKNIYRKYRQVDACMSSLMRPAIYGAHHHITVLGKNGKCLTEVVDVVGSLCENNDKFAVKRRLPKIHEGDVLIIQDTGAHGHAMGFNYNGRFRPRELLLREHYSVELIRREENPNDYFATLNFEKKVII